MIDTLSAGSILSYSIAFTFGVWRVFWSINGNPFDNRFDVAVVFYLQLFFVMDIYYGEIAQAILNQVLALCYLFAYLNDKNDFWGKGKKAAKELGDKSRKLIQKLVIQPLPQGV